jgi:pimeloyl-ACP methyl ester carboxylesterase
MEIKTRSKQTEFNVAKPKDYEDESNYKTNYLRQGTGTPAVLIHGLAASLHDWDSLIPKLAGAGFDACAVDLLGHGDSFKPAQLDEYTINNVYAHIDNWIRNLFPNEPFFMVGHSLGGYLALIYAIQNPGRIKGLVLVNPYYSLGQMSGFLRMVFRHPLLDTTLIRMTPYWLFRILIDLTSFQWSIKLRKHHNLPEEIRIQTALDYKRAAPGIYNIPRTMIELKDQLSSVSIPILIIWGENDRTLNPSSFSKLAKELVNAAAFPMSSCGHVPHQCDPFTFNKLVMDFFEKHR